MSVAILSIPVIKIHFIHMATICKYLRVKNAIPRAILQHW